MEAVQKIQLRRHLLKARVALGRAEVQARSQRMIDQAIQLISWHNTSSLHTYVPIDQKGEVDTWPLIRYVWQDQPSCLVAVPTLQDSTIVGVQVTPSTTWCVNALGVQEPEDSSQWSDDRQYDVIIVPLLGFTQDGYRLGYGGGYYDKFLATQPNALTIGLCYDEGQISFEPEPHDVPLKLIITDKKIHQI